VVLVALSSCADGTSRPRTAAVSADTKATYDFVVPRGTNELALRGETVNIVPNPFVIKVGEVVRIRNDDVVGYTVGPFYVGPNQTMTQIATTPGEFKGVCLLHVGEELKVIITKA
jgi:plastocyanin